ncbi:YdcF family protein [Thermus thermamylovorans]|uniref:YdcF family protein n=1 Tax=Thermus thermamylovorans TaxID=2509362 RepID=A0A4Q9B022_9DEIN|nr:YdcF family protein [Thermus thermamylovorans]TBH17392.1 YdcF family protein [Thermus thermamylovorans]
MGGVRGLLPLLLFFPPALAQGYAWIVVLGAAQYGGRPSPALERRLETALELYAKGLAPGIAVAGGRLPGDRFSEGEVGCRYLLERGVPGEALLCETQSRNTYENLLFLRPRLQGPVLLVTDAPHLPRALFLARLLGLEARGHPVPGPYPPGYWLREALYRLWLYLGLRPSPGGQALRAPPPGGAGPPDTPPRGP